MGKRPERQTSCWSRLPRPSCDVQQPNSRKCRCFKHSSFFQSRARSEGVEKVDRNVYSRSLWSAAAKGSRSFIRLTGDAALACRGAEKSGMLCPTGVLPILPSGGSQSGVARTPLKASESFCRRTPHRTPPVAFSTPSAMCGALKLAFVPVALRYDGITCDDGRCTWCLL